MRAYCYGCEDHHERPVADQRGWPCPNPAAEKFCSCGHKVERCAPENCRSNYARDALWGNA